MPSLTLNWLQLLAALGALHGVLLTVVLVAQRRNRTANRLLAALMGSFSFYLASSVYYAAGIVRYYPHFLGISYQMPWIFGPLVYLYARAASDRAWHLRPRHLLHFVPVAISISISLPIFLLSGAEKVALFDRWIAGDVPRGLALFDPTKYISGIAYSVATMLWLRKHHARIRHSYSNVARVNLSWLIWLTAGAFAVWGLAATLRIAGTSTRLRDEHVSLGIAIVVFGIGYMGLRQPEVFRYETQEFPVVTRAEIASPSPVVAEGRNERAGLEAGSERPAYERSGLNDADAEALHASLLRVMETDAPWKDSELTLPDLAARLDSTPHKLSELLNTHVGTTFYDFVNGYRVREVQRRIKAGDARSLKILALAMDAGFASKSTFNQVFKKHTNQTPSDFRQAVGA